MINFQEITVKTFLKDFWQKKPLVIPKALPNFINPLSPDELAGLALEEDIESRLVYETKNQESKWHLKKGPFLEKDFADLPKTHWTLLVQGVDRVIPEVYALLNHFDFIPQWRFDDVMISYAVLNGSVGPHYDNYDVFLYQAKGRRKWSLTTKNCHVDNYIKDLELRIMKEFEIESEFILEEGDLLYLPPHVGHYGISLSEECMTYSFGYRSYQGQELWDSFGDYLSEQDKFRTLYQDPDWSQVNQTSELPQTAWQNAQKLLQQLVNNEKLIKSWFGCFATRLDQSAEHQLADPLEENELVDLPSFINEIKQGADLERDPTCRFAYQISDDQSEYQFYINGSLWKTHRVSSEFLSIIANNRFISGPSLKPFLSQKENQLFLYELWKLQWIQINQ
jgi:50S ribosomal protein L16 3-hydroxylase